MGWGAGCQSGLPPQHTPINPINPIAPTTPSTPSTPSIRLGLYAKAPIEEGAILFKIPWRLVIHGEQRQGGDSTNNLCETIKRLRDLLVADSEGGAEGGSEVENEGGSEVEEDPEIEAQEEDAADHTHMLVHRPHLATFPSLDELMALPHAWSAEERAALLGDWFWEEHPSRIVADFVTSCQDGVDAADDADYADDDAAKRAVLLFASRATVEKDTGHMLGGTEAPLPPSPPRHCHLTPLHLTSPHRTC